MHPSIVKPVVATPRSQLKRKHGEIVDLTTNDTDTGNTFNSDQANGATSALPDVQGQQLGADDFNTDDDDDDDDDSMLGDALDEIELNPYHPPEGEGLTDAEMTRLRTELRAVGIDNFLRRNLSSQPTQMAPRLLGTVFGIDPEWLPDDAFHFLLLKKAIERASLKRQKLPQYNTIDDAAQLLRTRRNIMVITGAGISTSLGIPDFRSKNTGFYDKVKAMGLAEGEEVFDIHEFDHDPTKFYSLAGDILPDLKRFSPTHAFIKLLQDEGRLQTNYTQNIDNLEQLAGVDQARLIQCHGSFATATCRKCRHQVPGREIFDDIRAKRVSRCKSCLLNPTKPTVPSNPRKRRKGSTRPQRHVWEDSDDESDGAYDIPQPGVMKPDITFFGEQLPDTFFTRFSEHDCKAVDLVLVMGTSLKVAPVSEMSRYLPPQVPHVYVSREPIKHVNFDIQLLGDCDHVAFELCRRAGWTLKHAMIPDGFKVKVKPVEGSGEQWRVLPRESNKKSGAVTPASRAGTPGSLRASPSPLKVKASVREASRSPRPPAIGKNDGELRPFYEKYLGKA